LSSVRSAIALRSRAFSASGSFSRRTWSDFSSPNSRRHVLSDRRRLPSSLTHERPSCPLLVYPVLVGKRTLLDSSPDKRLGARTSQHLGTCHCTVADIRVQRASNAMRPPLGCKPKRRNQGNHTGDSAPSRLAHGGAAA
jgi:hypothetical protein